MNWVNVEESRIGRPRRIWHEGVQTAMGIWQLQIGQWTKLNEWVTFGHRKEKMLYLLLVIFSVLGSSWKYIHYDFCLNVYSDSFKFRKYTNYQVTVFKEPITVAAPFKACVLATRTLSSNPTRDMDMCLLLRCHVE
jgi:hypothetical protein